MPPMAWLLSLNCGSDLMHQRHARNRRFTPIACMIRTAFAAGALLGAAGSMAAENVCERVVVTGNPDYPPIIWAPEQGEQALTGVAVEMLQSALAASDIKVEVLNMGTRAKALAAVESGQVDIMAGLFMSRERLASMDYVYPAIMDVPSVFFVRRGAAFAYTGWQDLRGKRGAAQEGSRFGLSFDTYAKDNLALEREATGEAALRKLLAGKLDYVVLERYQGLALAQQMGVDEQLDTLEGSFINAPLYFGISHNSVCNSPDLRAALALGMQEQAQRNEGRRLLDKYRGIWAAPFMPAVEPAAEIPLEE
ncbi:amino acid ABC transporter substrate-binding protein [Pseudomonas neustonica]|uniref:Amino acid ABC transporter substrate-binding protein n=2 Tax=Pseudomonas TaxID=286 RepID=A0ABX9XHA9_9PSED|nr:amino acid ABC transporter substrate-binding protein [Pseudomonas sp. SSM44]ROZ84069.1 amino acid ABC transporter substrate-binding protein [Pseudomonas neustonica]